MQPLIQCEFAGHIAHLAHSTRADGDLSPSTVARKELTERRRRAVDHPWCVARQIHSDRAIVVRQVDAVRGRPTADALVTTEPNLALAVHSGDCVPVGFVSESGAIGVAHAGWKGLEAGVLESTVRCLRSFDPSAQIVAAVGPHIRASKYEFGAADLERLAMRFGADIVAETEQGSPALDLTQAISSELEALGVQVDAWSPDCTAADADVYWSHRARNERGRIALVAWIEPTADSDQTNE